MNKDEALRLALEALKTCQIDGDGWSGPHYWFDSEKVGKAIPACEQALEQPEQEPCVHAKNPKGCHRVRCQLGNKCVDDDMAFRTSPPKREPLTDEQIKDALVSVDAETKRLPSGFRDFARAIEAAHGIKGEA